MIEIKQGELERLGALLKEYEIQALIARYVPQAAEVRFDVQRLDGDSLAASFPRMKSEGPYFITLSPLLIDWDLTDRVAFSTIILHELAHIIDRVRNWTRYSSNSPLDCREALEYEADDFVIACGWRDGLIATLRRSIECQREHGMPEDMTSKRLSRLTKAV
ncbi:MAG: hypothetical protein WA802_03250 [Terracidiphilus sp.]